MQAADEAAASGSASISPLTANDALRSYTFDAAFKHVHTLIKLACLRPGAACAPQQSVLLSAPQGTGKTAFVQEAARMHGLPLVSVPHLLLSPASLASAFSSARQRTPALLLLDDIHCMFPRSSDDPQHQYRLISSLLSLLSSLSASSTRGLLVIATSSPAAISRLHPAVRSAFEFTFTTTVPSAEHRLFILQRLLSPVSPPSGLPFLSELNAQCQGRTGADLLALCRAAAQQAAQSGDAALTVAHFTAALAETRPSMLERTLQRVELGGGGGERVGWDAVLGLDDVKQRLLECVQPLLPSSAVCNSSSPVAHALRPPAGVLLYGLPGTGKTLLAQALSSVAELSFFSLPLASLLHSRVGDSERAVQAAFDAALKAAPAVLFIDEIDSLFAAQPEAASESVTSGVVAVLASLLSAVTERRLPLLLLAASNLPQRIHPSLLSASRLSLLLYVPPPSAAELRQLLLMLLGQQGLQLSSAAAGQEEQQQRRLEALLSGLTAADLRYLVGSLTVAVRAAGCRAVSIADLEAARQRQSGSVTPVAEAALRLWVSRTGRKERLRLC